MLIKIRQKLLSIKIRQKLLIMFLILLIIPSTVLGIVSYVNAKKGLEDQTEKGLQNYVLMAIEMIDMHQELVDVGHMTLEEAQEEMIEHLGLKGDADNALGFDLGDNGYFFILDEEGTFVAHPTLEGENYWEEESEDGVLYVQEIVKQGLDGGGFTKYKFPLPEDPDTVKTKVSYSKVDPNWGWIIGVGSYTHEHNRYATRLLSTAGITLVLTTMVGAAAALFFANFVSRPIQRIADHVRQIANGDLTVSPLNIKTGDELEMLAGHFNQMLTSLKKMIGQTAEVAQQVASTSVQLAAGSEQTSKASEHISLSVQEVVSDAETQAEKTEQAANIINEMTAEFKEVNTQAESAASTSQETVKTAHAGNDTVAKAENQMTLIGQTSDEMEKAMRGLEERSNEIGDIISLITDIADQTNLLALNASIEAARAGEEGRGFSVVANEVRQLAEQSGAATDKVRTLISEIQGEIQQTAELIGKNGGFIREGVQMASDAGAAFQTISGAVNEVETQIQQVSARIRKMDEETDHLVQTIADVEKISQATVDYAQNVAASTEEQTASMEEVAAVTQTLQQMAEELQRTVDGFILE